MTVWSKIQVEKGAAETRAKGWATLPVDSNRFFGENINAWASNWKE